jgi:hypothetical protein
VLHFRVDPDLARAKLGPCFITWTWFVLGNPLQSGLRIEGQGQSQPIWSTFQMLTFWVSSWFYQQMLRLEWKVIARAKCSSLLQKGITYGCKKFYNMDTRGQCHKTTYGHKLRLFIISKSICPWQAFPAKSNVCR